MDWTDLAWYLVISGVGIVAGYVLVHLTWHVHSRWRIHRAGPRRLLATRHRLWQESATHGPPDLRFGPGGAGLEIEASGLGRLRMRRAV